MATNGPLQTLVVSLDQLTAENMAQLSQAGYSILRDPNLVIFGRPVPQQNMVQASELVGEEENQVEEVVEDAPVSLPNRKRR